MKFPPHHLGMMRVGLVGGVRKHREWRSSWRGEAQRKVNHPCFGPASQSHGERQEKSSAHGCVAFVMLVQYQASKNSNIPRNMTLNPKLTKLLNEQINNEMASSYIYLAMAAWFEQTPYSGFAQWMFTQSREETMHALKFYQYVVDRDAKVELQPIAKPKADFKIRARCLRAQPKTGTKGHPADQ
jgi:hypothetical protein